MSFCVGFVEMKPATKTCESMEFLEASGTVSEKGKRALVTIASPPPAKRLKQACLPFKFVTSVELNFSSTPKRELSNYVETAPVEARRSKEDYANNNVDMSVEPEGYKENQLPCDEQEQDWKPHEADKNQRPISEYLSPSKRTTNEKSIDPTNACPDCSVVIDLVDQKNCKMRMEIDACFTNKTMNENKSPQASMKASSVDGKDASPIHRDETALEMANLSDELLESSYSTGIVTDRSVGEATDVKLDTNVGATIDVSSSSANDERDISSSAKKVKKFKKVKKDPANEFEKTRLKEERKKAQEAKEKLKAELCRLKAERMEQKLKAKQEKQQREEREKQEKQHLKDEEKKKKQEALDAKQEEKDRKKREKLDMEEEKKEGKRRLEEDEKRKNQKTKEAFINFFVKKSSPDTVWQKPKNLGTFLPFQVKENMRLAPTHRNVSCNTAELTDNLDSLLSRQHGSAIYLDEIKFSKTVPRSSDRTWAAADKDVEILECNDSKPYRKAKLLQFVENVRPPYWGTWCKRSAVINPRNPLKRDERFFNYELDSDDEWTDEEPGESLSHSEGEKESEDDYEVDNELFVPHGYLSEEEINDDGDKQIVTPDTLKAQLKIKEQEFQKDRKKKCLQIKPIIFGCIWMDSDQIEPKKALEEYSAVAVGSFPIETRFSVNCESGKKISPNVTTPRCRTGETLKGSSSIKNAKEFPIEAMPYLIRLVHGNQHSSKLMCREFQEFWQRHVDEQTSPDSIETGRRLSPEDNGLTAAASNLSIIQLQSTIRKIATWGKFPDKGPLFTSLAWYVTLDKRLECGLDALPIPNKWEYCAAPETLKKSAVSRVDNNKASKVSGGPGTIDFFAKATHSSPHTGSPTAPRASFVKADKCDAVTFIGIVAGTASRESKNLNV